MSLTSFCGILIEGPSCFILEVKLEASWFCEVGWICGSMKCISYCFAFAECTQLLLTQRKWTKADHCHPLWMLWDMEGIGCTKQPASHTLPKKHFLLSLLGYWARWIFLFSKIGIY